MARKNQILINYHTSGLTSMPLASEVELGEIVVRHADERPELLLKTNNGEFAVIPSSGAVASAISSAATVLEGAIQAVESKVQEANSGVSILEKYVKETYATSADTVSAIDAAKNESSAYTDSKIVEVYGSATTFATNAVEVAVTTLEGNIEAVDGRVSDLSGATEAFKSEVTTTYATSADTVSAIAKAKDEAIAAASAYTDGEIAEVFTSATTVVSGALVSVKEELEGEIEAIESAMNSGFTEIRGKLSATTEDLTDLINDKVARAYRYKGSCLYAELPASGEVVGEVWNVTDANGDYPAGTNYAWNGSEWDALGGSVDLSPYHKTSDFNEYVEETAGELDAIRASISEANSGVSILEKYVKETYATSADTVSAIAKAQNESSAYTDTKIVEVYGSATTFATNAVATAKEEIMGEVDTLESAMNSGFTALTAEIEANELTTAAAFNKFNESAGFNENGESVLDGGKSLTQGILDAESHIVEVYGSATTFATNAVSTAKTELQGAIDGVSALVSENTEAIKGVKATADTAVQTFSVNCGVKASNDSTVGTFDFSEMIIDGGEF
jgi:hypothetical protein